MEGSLWVASQDQERRQFLSLETPRVRKMSIGGEEASGKKMQVVKWQRSKHLIKTLHMKDEKELCDMQGHMQNWKSFHRFDYKTMFSLRPLPHVFGPY